MKIPLVSVIVVRTLPASTVRGRVRMPSGFGMDSVYTPQMAVEGTSEFVGSDSGLAAKAFAHPHANEAEGVWKRVLHRW